MPSEFKGGNLLNNEELISIDDYSYEWDWGNGYIVDGKLINL